MGQADYRAAVVTLMSDCATDAGVTMQIYRGRPASLYPPTGFIDAMGDDLSDFVGNIFQHTPTIQVVLVWGLLDSGEAVDQRDAFVDAFHEWQRQAPHAAGPATLIKVRSLADDPNFVPDWLPEAQQKVYYATRITMEGFATD